MSGIGGLLADLVSHAPDEHAEPDDCAAGVTALARVLAHPAGSSC